MKTTILYVLALICLCLGQNATDFQPTRLRISYTHDADDMMITWTTLQNPPTKSIVNYGFDEQALTFTILANTTKFRTFYIHRALISGVGQSKRVWYQCGSWIALSDIASFKTRNLDTNSSVRMLLYGDLGIVNGQSIPRIIDDVNNNAYDVIHHVGDIAYDMDVDNGEYGQTFLKMMEDVSKQVAYMVSSGNHESGENFMDYKNQYTMPGDTQNMWYSYDIGPIHIVTFSTELYYDYNYGIKPLLEQFDWLKKDLKKAALPENREKHPWIIIMGHHPMYCSTTDKDDCTFGYSLTRVGIPFLHWLGIEPLLKEYGVDLAIWAHEHIYERMWPVYNLKVYNGSYSTPYTNPGAPTHIITGSAGCQERHDDFKKHHPPYSALRNADYGYTRMTVENTTHLHLEQISDDKGGQVVDEIWLIRDKHGPYPNL